MQNWLVGMVTNKLSAQLGTQVNIKHVNISLFNRADIEGVFIADKNKDTLLYAGQLKVRITDWFMFKDKAVIKYVGLEDAVIKLQRSDSVWNYQFIVEHFSSPKKPSTTTQTKNKNSDGGIAFNLQKIDFKNIRFINNDRWVGEEINVGISSFVVNADTVDLNKGSFIINSIAIEKPTIVIENFEPLRPEWLKKPKTIDSISRLNPAGLFVKVKELSIHDGLFAIQANQHVPLKHFDGEHLAFNSIKGNFKNVYLLNDTLTANMKLSCKERSGLVVKNLIADYKVNPQIMEFKNLDVETNRSKLSNYLAMKFEHFDYDFANFVSHVTMVADFNNASVHSNDIALFAPAIASFNKNVQLSGKFKGTITDFNINNLLAKTGHSTIRGNLAMKGLPNIDKTIISLQNGAIYTNAIDLNTYIPVLKTFTNPNITALGNITYKGNFNGYYHNFKTKGNINTDLGALYADLAFNFPTKQEPIYAGTLHTEQFDVGKFINTPTLGNIAFEGKVDGSSFTLDKMKASIDGTIKKLELNNYAYTNITTLGTFEKQAFNGQVKIADPNLDFIGIMQIDVSGNQPRFNLFADILKSNYRELKLINTDNWQVTGTLDVNFSGTNIDNFEGEAKLLNAVVTNNGKSIEFDLLKLSSDYSNNKKNLNLSSADFSGSVSGDFSIMGLPASFQTFLHRYYPAYVPIPDTIPQNQDFSFHVTTGYIAPYLQLVDTKMAGLDDIDIAGTINTKENKLHTIIQVPSFIYDKYHFSGINITGDGTMDSLIVAGDVFSIIINDSTNLPMTTFNIRSANDHSLVKIQTRASSTLNDASLAANVFTLEDGVRVEFQPSSFVINEKKWNIEKNGIIVLRKNFLSTKDFNLQQGFQEINFNTEFEEDNNATNLIVDVKNVVLGDFVGYALKDPRLEGLTTGKISINNLFNTIQAKADIEIDNFKVDDDSIGIAKVLALYDGKTGKISWNWISPNADYLFNVQGSYETKDSTAKDRLYTDIVFKKSKIKPIQKYLKGIFSDVDGLATGTLTIKGNDTINLIGNVTLKDAGLLVDYTQVYYNIDSATIKFEEDGINFGSFVIRDMYNNKGNVRGKLYEKGFKDMAFDFDLSTNKLLLLNTQAKDNQQFYGKAIGKATLSFKGPETNAKMIIVGNANDTSHIYIPNSISRESADADFIVFKQFGEAMAEQKNTSKFNLSIDLDLTANEKVDIDVILDDLAGDVIKATGNGRLRIKVGTNEKLDIRGKYNIARGKYDFNFQSLIKKPFLLMPDAGNYIEWTGDAMDAKINIDAMYEADNVRLSDLTGKASGIMSSNVSSLRESVYVIAQLRDKLMQPSIKFKIDFPTNSPVKTDPDFAQFLTRMEKDENEMLQQATSLIVFGAFAPYGQGLLSSGAGGGGNLTGYVNSLSQRIMASASNLISGFLSKLFNDKSLKVDLGTSIYSSSSILNQGVSTTGNRIDRSIINFKIGKSFFNDNVIVTFGTDVDFNIGSAVGGNTQWLPDFNIEFVLSKDKKLRAIIFNKNSLDISGATFGKRNRQGLSISYRQEFETLFGKKQTEDKRTSSTPILYKQKDVEFIEKTN
ncbi:MAG: translocation/assembly module TamB domain-containing protein [Chitinophagaceae bacterium]|nr:translocation/assembly module TamB domain-containing protein [Chitinophagaceae bacterium]MCW5904783.1 translocation/assembly module TamB domain-containing protein [Chitinophagaceae bacterium]